MSADTPILALYREHERLRVEAGATPWTTDEEDNARFWDPQDEIEAQMMALPSTCAADFAAKAIVATVRGGAFPDWEEGDLWREARALVNCTAHT